MTINNAYFLSLWFFFSLPLFALECGDTKEKDVVWYVHLQTKYVPYAPEISALIEKSYQEFSKNLTRSDEEKVKSASFKIQSYDYVIDFEDMVQKRRDPRHSHIYRYVRRISYSRVLGNDERNHAINLELVELEDLAGHTFQNMSQEDRVDYASKFAGTTVRDGTWNRLKEIIVRDSARDATSSVTSDCS